MPRPLPTYVPLMSVVAAGTGTLPEDVVEELLPLPRELVGQGQLLMLQVRGDSMVGAGVLDRDYVVVRRQDTADNGDMVAALLPNDESEATVKHFAAGAATSSSSPTTPPSTRSTATRPRSSAGRRRPPPPPLARVAHASVGGGCRVVIKTMYSHPCRFAAEAVESGRCCTGADEEVPMPTGRHSKGRAAVDPGLTRRRFLRAAGVGTAGAMVAAGAVAGQAGAEVAGAAVPVPRPSRSRPAARRPASSCSRPAPPPPWRSAGRSRSTPSRRSATWTRGSTAAARSRPRAPPARSSSSTSGTPTTSPAASRTRCRPAPGDRLQPHRHRRHLRQPARLPGQQRRDPAGLQRELDGRPDGRQLRHRGRDHPRRRLVPGRRRLHNASTKGSVHVIVDISGFFI